MIAYVSPTPTNATAIQQDSLTQATKINQPQVTLESLQDTVKRIDDKLTKKSSRILTIAALAVTSLFGSISNMLSQYSYDNGGRQRIDSALKVVSTKVEEFRPVLGQSGSEIDANLNNPEQPASDDDRFFSERDLQEEAFDPRFFQRDDRFYSDEN